MKSTLIWLSAMMMGLLLVSGAHLAAEETVEFSNADLACSLAEMLELEESFAGTEETLGDEARFQQCLNLLPQSLQEILVTLYPSGPVLRQTMANIIGLYMEESDVNAILGEGVSEDTISRSAAVTALEQSGFADQFQNDETLGFIAPDPYDFEATERESEQLQEDYRIPLSGGDADT